MSPCSEFADLLALDVFGELGADEAEAVRLHVAACAACRAERAALADARGRLDEAAAPRLAPGEGARLRAQAAGAASDPGAGPGANGA
ncbi:MAG: zf-HC2 domain-containing protein, partial [Planctomycetes bacterium]|nr:zf-HC2 domain-containing protein [Planctomycetota bacterium]